MEGVKTLLAHVANKEFIQFSDELKSMVQDKIDSHPRMVEHRDIVKRSTDQIAVYSSIKYSVAVDPET